MKVNLYFDVARVLGGRKKSKKETEKTRRKVLE
jgi:hypothetical protein